MQTQNPPYMKTSISTKHPCVVSLRKDVENIFNHTLTSLTDFEQLASAIENVTHEHLNTDTLRRLWGVRHDSYESVRLSMLNILSQYAGSQDWDDYCEHLRKESNTESDTTAEKRVVRASDLCIGDEVTLCWLPKRVCRIRYSGDNTWQVAHVEESHTLQEDDTFACAEIVECETLYATGLTRNGQQLGAVRLGIDNGVRFG